MPRPLDDTLLHETVIDEAALVAGLRRGDNEAFELLVRTFGGRLLAVARRMVRNEEDARDVVQTAYLSAFRGLDTFAGGCQLSTWLHRIVVNAALMKLRSQRRKPEESIEELLPAFQDDGHHVEQFSDWTTPADQLLEKAETRATVRGSRGRDPRHQAHGAHDRYRPNPKAGAVARGRESSARGVGRPSPRVGPGASPHGCSCSGESSAIAHP